MAGKMRGRGRGKSAMSVTMEHLGLTKDDLASEQVLQPSSLYPSLDHRPLPIQLDTEMSYLVELKRDYTEFIRESPNNVQAIVLNEDIERYCEDEENIVKCKSEYESRYDWNRMPTELKSLHKRKVQQKQHMSKKQKNIDDKDIEKKLAELEAKENARRASAEQENAEERSTKKKAEKENSEDKEIVMKEEVEVDEEMDDGTDYVNEYFETGDNYYSEDDNDDGPVF